MQSLNSLKLSYSQLIFEETLGTGQFSSVRKAQTTDGSKEYAVKIISKSDPDKYDREFILTELRILSIMSHPNIPKIYGFYEDKDRVHIFMENIKGGDLFDFIKKKEVIDQKEAAFIAFELLKTLKYIQELRIIHRDIKPENILIKTDQDERIVHVYLIDFGLSTFYTQRNAQRQACGTLGYVAPEVLSRSGYGEAADIYSIGIVLYLLVTGYLPFDHRSDSKLMDMTINSPLPLNPAVFSKLDPNLPHLLLGMTAKLPDDRMTIEECLDHPFLR